MAKHHMLKAIPWKKEDVPPTNEKNKLMGPGWRTLANSQAVIHASHTPPARVKS